MRTPLSLLANPLKSISPLTHLRRPIYYTEEIIDRYQTALDEAMKIATKFNVYPIAGRTCTVVAMDDDDNKAPGGASLGKSATNVSLHAHATTIDEGSSFFF